MQKFRPNRLSKISVFGLKSAIFDSSIPTEPKNELETTKKNFRGLWDPFGAGRKFFDHPAPKRSIWGCRNFCKIAFLGPNFSSFRLWEVSRAPKWFGRYQKLFTKAMESFWCGPKKFRPPHPKKSDFWGAEISTKRNLTISGPKKIFFWPFFELVEGRSLGG